MKSNLYPTIYGVVVSINIILAYAQHAFEDSKGSYREVAQFDDVERLLFTVWNPIKLRVIFLGKLKPFTIFKVLHNA